MVDLFCFNWFINWYPLYRAFVTLPLPSPLPQTSPTGRPPLLHRFIFIDKENKRLLPHFPPNSSWKGTSTQTVIIVEVTFIQGRWQVRQMDIGHCCVFALCRMRTVMSFKRERFLSWNISSLARPRNSFEISGIENHQIWFTRFQVSPFTRNRQCGRSMNQLSISTYRKFW